MPDDQIRFGIYNLERIGETDYGYASGFVIIESSDIQARVCAGYADGGSKSIEWADPAAVTCTFLGWAVTGETARVVMSEKLGE